MYRNDLKYSSDGCQKHLNSKTGNGSRIMIFPLMRVIMPERSFSTKQLNTSETETKYCPVPALRMCGALATENSKCTGRKNVIFVVIRARNVTANRCVLAFYRFFQDFRAL
ncbi:hypothetical protein CEXT_226751 [Caerostris extrusa]|uniref:Uncharacterized protein n=1 Tax=Caerostris extrusa TaxID=172846 RepID=A0AAV4XRB0_CAEEX|nr:hypothetical protein CEXT_226751 [Caerostris extrusa]